MPVQWIISDVDGCLCPEESVAWNLEHFAALARGIRSASDGRSPVAPMTLCTGRPQPYVEVLMKLLDIRAPAICENGAVIYSLPDNHARYGPGVTEEKLAGLRSVVQYLETTVLPKHPGVVRQFGKDAQLSLYSAEPAALAPCREAIEAFVLREGLPPLVQTMSHYYLNVSLEGVDKGRALDALLEELGIAREEAAGIGDTEGDLPLRERVGYFACPSNAQDSIKKTADFVASKPIMDGVVEILKQPAMRRA